MLVRGNLYIKNYFLIQSNIMSDTINYKELFLAERDKIFNNRELYDDSYKFCVRYSLLVEEYIIKLIKPKSLNCVLAAVGGFSRRELSPYSDIDLMFIFNDSVNHDVEIQNCVTVLWDAGIEVSHTVREFSDIDNVLDKDLPTFTQFFETRFLIGDKNTYDEWNNKLFYNIDKLKKEKLIYDYFKDVEVRYRKYGRSPKVLEPNLKFTAGGLRDIHAVEWMYSIKAQKLQSGQSEVIQTELFFKELLENQLINRKAYKRLYDSYKTVLRARNMLHLVEGRKNDRLEFSQQELIAKKLGYPEHDWKQFMHEYFSASTVLNRFSKTMMKRYKEEFSTKLSHYLAFDLDDDFEVKGDLLFFKNDRILDISDIMRAFYYRCLNDARFEQNLRSLIIESIHLIEETKPLEATSSVFFREMLKLPAHVGKTLLAMNEFGFLDILLPEFRNLNGFFQPGVYHCYTADEHTLIALENVENLLNEDNHMARIFKALQAKDVLYLSILLHDIGKPISVSGHEIIGAEIANSIMQSLGYGQNEIMLVQFLVRFHLEMEQIAFRRDLNDPATLDNFISIFPSSKSLDYLYLLSYADLSAVNTHVWTQWKADLLQELYSKSKSMLHDQISGEELITEKSNELFNEKGYSNSEAMVEHLDQVDDISYLFHFSIDEINQHIMEIEKGSKVSVFFKENDSFTNITVVTKDSSSLLAKLCGAIAIKDLNIHDAKIFTRKDGIVIDSFNVSDFRTQNFVNEKNYPAIEKAITKTLAGQLNIEKEFEKVKSRWKRIINTDPITQGSIEIDFEEHNKFTIIDIYAPDKIGLLYTITHKMAELGLTVAFAKISTKVDGVLDAFYIQKNNGEKLRKSEYGFIRSELEDEIKKI